MESLNICTYVYTGYLHTMHVLADPSKLSFHLACARKIVFKPTFQPISVRSIQQELPIGSKAALPVPEVLAVYPGVATDTRALKVHRQPPGRQKQSAVFYRATPCQLQARRPHKKKLAAPVRILSPPKTSAKPPHARRFSWRRRHREKPHATPALPPAFHWP